MKGGGRKPETFEDIRIPELEEEAKRLAAFQWDDKELAILRKYYGKVPVPSLLKYLPGKDKDTVYRQAQREGLNRKKGKAPA